MDTGQPEWDGEDWVLDLEEWITRRGPGIVFTVAIFPLEDGIPIEIVQSDEMGGTSFGGHLHQDVSCARKEAVYLVGAIMVANVLRQEYPDFGSPAPPCPDCTSPMSTKTDQTRLPNDLRDRLSELRGNSQIHQTPHEVLVSNMSDRKAGSYKQLLYLRNLCRRLDITENDLVGMGIEEGRLHPARTDLLQWDNPLDRLTMSEIGGLFAFRELLDENDQ
jgi:hypothetical protein